jgi:hypothetical protein
MKRQTRRRRRGGNRKLKLAALLALPEFVKSQSLYDLGARWWNEGGLVNSKAFADAIVEAAEGIPTKASDILEELKTMSKAEWAEIQTILSQVPTAEPGYTSSMSAPPVAPTDVTSLPVVGQRFKVVKGPFQGNTVVFVRGANDEDEDEDEETPVYVVTISGDEDTSEYTVDPANLVPIGGKRRKPRRKTIRKKK